jgi:hypothetical protein
LLRRQWSVAVVLLGLGVAIEPLAVLVVVFMLFHRDTRRAALAAIVAAIAFTGSGLVYLAWRARGVSAAHWAGYFRTLNLRTGEPAGGLVCYRGNLSPSRTACMLLGRADFTTARIAALAGVTVLIALALGTMRGGSGMAIEVLAWGCLLSPMVSPIEWWHYGVLFGPMLLLLGVGFWERRASLALWAGLAVGYLLTQLVWNPAMSLPAQLSTLFGGGPEATSLRVQISAIGAIGQYVLVAVALVWFRPRKNAGQWPTASRHSAHQHPDVPFGAAT